MENMNCNDVLRSLRFTLDINDVSVTEIIKLGGVELESSKIALMLKKEEEEGFIKCPHNVMEAFLDGLIIKQRGKLENKDDKGSEPPARERMTNNVIMKKLKIAFDLKSEDVIEILKSQNVEISKSELSAVFRREGHRNYKECGDRYLRNFLKGLTDRFRVEKK